MHSLPSANATLLLWGHGRAAAYLDVERYSPWAWVTRVGVSLVLWIVGTVLTLVFTFDPFVASFPFVLGLGMVYGAIRGRYRVRAFAGACPRCNQAIELKPGRCGACSAP